MSGPYFNTNNERGEVLTQSVSRATKQEDVIMDFFRLRPGRRFSPEDVQAWCLSTSPLTSVRRAITNLTDQGKLIKTNQMKKGMYGKNVHTWELAQQGQTKMFL